MGDYRNNSWLDALSICILVLGIGVSNASADERTASDPAAPPHTVTTEDAPVSMSPALDPNGPSATPARAEDQGPALPLTRAAAREHVDRMTPRDWLANYGQVVVGRPD